MDQLKKTTRIEKEDSLVPEDPRPDWAKEDDEIEDRKPNLSEIEGDTSDL
jgi:hypothetical protein